MESLLVLFSVFCVLCIVCRCEFPLANRCVCVCVCVRTCTKVVGRVCCLSPVFCYFGGEIKETKVDANGCSRALASGISRFGVLISRQRGFPLDISAVFHAEIQRRRLNKNKLSKRGERVRFSVWQRKITRSRSLLCVSVVKGDKSSSGIFSIKRNKSVGDFFVNRKNRWIFKESIGNSDFVKKKKVARSRGSVILEFCEASKRKRKIRKFSSFDFTRAMNRSRRRGAGVATRQSQDVLRPRPAIAGRP